MTEYDNIKELFSKGLENHSAPVRPELWNGLQAKMAAAGVASGSAAAVKGISALTKWIIGGAAASAVAVTSVILVNQQDTPSEKEQTTSHSTAAVTETPVTGEMIQAGENQQSTNDESRVETTYDKTPLVLDYAADHISDEEAKLWEEVDSPKEGMILVKEIPSGNVPSKQDPSVGQSGPVKEQKKENAVAPPAEKKAEKKESRSVIQRIPNIFTPNNDGDNDTFFVESKFLSDFSVSIMNQKGEVMYKSADSGFKWDGTTLAGEDAPTGSYVCVIVAKGENNEVIKDYKIVELRR